MGLDRRVSPEEKKKTHASSLQMLQPVCPVSTFSVSLLLAVLPEYVSREQQSPGLTRSEALRCKRLSHPQQWETVDR